MNHFTTIGKSNQTTRLQRVEMITDMQMRQFAQLIEQHTGNRVPASKKTLLTNRLRKRLNATGIHDFASYHSHLTRLRSDHPEWDAFLQEITTHETYLFRDQEQWDWFRDDYLLQCAKQARSSGRQHSLRIWSAASSTGDEAYTAACCIADTLPHQDRWKIRIIGTDIGIDAIKQARQATFGQRAMRYVPDLYKKRYFTKNHQSDDWTAKPNLTDMIRFRQHNLLDPLREPLFDLVFLKNVLIYFKAEPKQQVMEHVRAMVRPGGFLVAGGAETIAGLVRDYIRYNAWLFQRPEEE